MVGHVLVPRTPFLRKTRDIHPHADDLSDNVSRGHEALDMGYQPRMVPQPGDPWVLVGVRENAV
jgi:hypothetical protein